MFKRGGARNEITFNLVSTTQSNIRIENTVGSRYLVDWGDGNKVPVTSLFTKTFSTPFSGTVSVSMMRGSTKFHVSTYGNMVSNGNIRVQLNQNVNYDTFKQITNLKYLYYSDQTSGVTASTKITGTFSNITDDLLKLKELHLVSGNPLSNYTIDITNLKNLNSIWIDTVKNSITGTISNIPTNNPNLDYFSIGYGYQSVNHPISGSINSFSQSTLRTFTVELNLGSNVISGDIGLLPSTLGTFSIAGLNTTTGSISNFPTSMSFYKNYGNNTTSGDIGLLPSTLKQYLNDGLNTTTGNIGSFSSNLTLYFNDGKNTTTGNIGLLPASMTYYSNGGSNSTYGNIGSMSSALTYYYNLGYNTTTGNIANLPASMSSYYNYGSNTTTGDIGLLPSALRVYQNFGSNSTYGNIANLPNTLLSFECGGTNTTTGDIGLLPPVMSQYYNYGYNTTYGNIGSFSSNMAYFICVGSSSITGDLATLPPSIRIFQLSATNSTYGNLYNLPTNINSYINYNCMTNSFTASGGPTKSWNTLSRFQHLPSPGFGLTSSDVDQLLISLSTAAWSSPKAIVLNGANGPRTSASDAAVLVLSALGVSVGVNG
jgi:hypothetical protein